MKSTNKKNSKYHVLVDEELIGFLPKILEPLEIIPFKGRLLERSMIGGAEVLVVRSVTQVTQKLLDQSDLKLVCSATSGLDHIDQRYLKNSNIKLVNAPGSNAIAVVEYVIFLILMYSKLIAISFKKIRVGVIGYGEIGTRLTRILESLGVQVLINDPPKNMKSGLDRNHFPLEELVKECDCLSIHVPLNRRGRFPTENLINNELLAQLKDKVLIINSSRGGIIDEDSLSLMLDRKSGLKVALDCWKNEPNIDASLVGKVWLATPHIAGSTVESKYRAVGKILPSIFNHYGLKNRKINSNIETKISESITKTSNNEIEELINAVFPLNNLSKKLKSIAEFCPTELLMMEFDSLRKSAATRRELSYYEFASNLLLINRITELSRQI